MWYGSVGTSKEEETESFLEAYLLAVGVDARAVATEGCEIKASMGFIGGHEG